MSVDNEMDKDEASMDDVWASVEQPTPESGQDAQPPLDEHVDGEGDHLEQDFADHDEQVVDVDSTPVPPKKSYKALAVIAVIGLSAIGGTGFLGYSLYSKLFPGDTAVQGSLGGVALVDTSVSMPGAPVDSAMAAAPVSVPGLAPALPDAPPVTTETSAPASATSVDVAAAVPVTPVATTTVQAPAPVEAVSPVLAPAVAAAAAAASPEPPQAAPVVKATAPEKASSPKRATSKPQTTTRVAQRKPQARNKAVASAKVAPPGKSSPSTDGASRSVLGFKLLAIEPKVGSFQQAWLRAPDGSVHIVSEGDQLKGLLVTSIRHASGVVQTDAGVIAK